MTHVVTERCVDCRYTDCCAVCPVDCFFEVKSPALLVIAPDICIDCGLCVPECPIQAIWPESELPDVYREWTKRNAELYSNGTMIKTKKDALPGALPLGQIHARERKRGWQVKEPSGAGAHATEEPTEPGSTPPAERAKPPSIANPLPVPKGLTSTQASVFEATANTIYRWRTVPSVAQQVGLPQGSVQGDLEKLVELGHVQRRSPKTNGVVVYGAVARVK